LTLIQARVQDEIKTGVIPAMTSDSDLAFLVDWTEYGKNPMLRGNFLGSLFFAVLLLSLALPLAAIPDSTHHYSLNSYCIGTSAEIAVT
jgi:hypothetical protein